MAAKIKGSRIYCLSNNTPYLSSVADFSFSHFWFETALEVLTADWQDTWHSPQPYLELHLIRPLLLMIFKCATKNPP